MVIFRHQEFFSRQTSQPNTVAVGADAVEKAIATRNVRCILAYEDLRLHRITAASSAKVRVRASVCVFECVRVSASRDIHSRS